MDDQSSYTGAKSALKSLRLEERGKSWALIHALVAYTGWLLLLIVVGLLVIAPDVEANPTSIAIWCVFFFGYLIALEILSRTRKALYETFGFRMFRIQVVLFFGTALIILTGGSGSDFWFIYLWPLFATALYATWWWTWGVYAEIVIQYSIVSLWSTGSLGEIELTKFLVNLFVLLIVTVVLRLFFDSIRRYESARSKVVYYELLQQIQQDVDSAIDMQSVLAKILRRSVESVGARDGTIMLLDEEDVLRFHARHGELVPKDKIERTFRRGEGIAGRVIETRKYHVCDDTKSDRLFADVIAGSAIGSLVCVPIISHGTVLGVINVDSPETRRFTRADAELLQTLADQTAIAIERAELLDGLKEISEKALHSAEELNQAIVDVLHKLTRSPVALWQVDSEKPKQARIIAHKGLRSEYAETRIIDFETSIVGRVIKSGKHDSVFDIAKEPRVSKETKAEAAINGWMSFLVVPLLTRLGEAKGAVSIYSSTKKRYTLWEIDRLSAFAGQAGIALQNSDRLLALRKVSTSINLDLGPEEVGGVILDELKKVVGYDTASLQIIRGETEDRVLLTGRGFDVNSADRWYLRPLSEDALIRQIFTTRKPLILGVPLEYPDWEVREETKNVKSWVGLPLVQGDEVIGLLTLDHSHPGFYTPTMEDFLVPFANQAAIAIKKAELSKRLASLQQISSEISATRNLDALLPKIVQSALTLTGTEDGVVHLLDDDGSRFFHSYGYPPEVEQPQPRIEDGGLTSQIVSEKAQVVVLGAEIEERAHPEVRRRGVKSIVGTPLLLRNPSTNDTSQGDRVIGVLYLNDCANRNFPQEQLRLIESLADVSAIAVENARLHEKQQRQINELRVLTEIGRIESSIGIDGILSRVYSLMCDIVDLTNAQVQFVFYDPHKDTVTFPLAVERENGQEIDRIKWGFREPQYRDVEEGEDGSVGQYQPRRRRTPPGLSEYVIRTGKPLLIDENFDESARNLGIQFWPTFGIRKRATASWFGVPMIVQGQIAGIISIQSLEIEHAFDEDLVRVLSIVANHAAVTIENARLLERERHSIRNLDALLLVGMEIASQLELEKLMITVTKSANIVAGASFSTLFVYDATSEMFVSGYRQGDIETSPSLPSKNGFATQLARSGEGLFVEDAANEPSMKQSFVDEKELKSFAAMPLLYEKKPVGVLFVNFLSQHAFTENEKQAVRLLASQAAVGIEKVNLYEKLRAAYDELKRSQEQRLWAELGKTAGSLAHRIGNKGNIVRVCANDLLQRFQELGVEDELLTGKLEMILRNVDYLLQMSDELFLPVEATRADLEKTDLSLVVADAMGSVDIPPDIQIKVSDDLTGLPPVPANRYFVEVFVELISNAIKAMNLSEEKVLSISGKVIGDRLEIRFSDTGPGIPPAKQKGMFDLFTGVSYESSPSEHKGFGLWWVKSFLMSIGGEINLETGPAHGTTVSIKLPLEVLGQ